MLATIQLAVYLYLLYADEYAGSLFAVIIGSICFSIWVLSYVIEWIEPSRVPVTYYQYLLTAWLAPASALIVYVMLSGGIGWLTP